MKSKEMVYVDIGGSHITLVAGKIRPNNSVQILGMQSISENVNVKSGIIKDPNSVAYQINTLIKFLQNAYGLDQVRQLLVGLNARSMKSYLYSVKKDILQEKITEYDLIELEKKCFSELELENINVFKVFQVFPIQYKVDDKVVENPLGLEGKELKINYSAIVGHALIKEDYTKCFERTGVKVNLNLSIEAVAKAVLNNKDKQGVALLMFGATATTLGIYQNGVLIDMMVIPFGGDNITNDIAEVGNMSKKYAEAIKKQKGRATKNENEKSVMLKVPNIDKNKEDVKLSTKLLAQIIEVRLEETLKPIINKINSNANTLPYGIVITGRPAQLNGLSEYLKERTQLQVRFGDHSNLLSEDTDPVFKDTRYSEAVGAFLL